MRFTIGTVSSSIEFEEDLKLIKSSLLYADEVELIGMAEYAVYKYLPRQLSDAKDLDSLITCFVPLLNGFDDEQMQDMAKQLMNVSDMLAPYKPLLNKKKHRTKQEIMAQMKAKQGEKQCRDLFDKAVQELQKHPATQEIKGLVEKNQISIFDYGFNNFNIEELTGGFFANLLGTMKHGTSYPLFDSISSDIVGSVINEKVLDLCNTDKEVLRHAGVATEILMTLPTLEGATVDEILDFKKGLRGPLEAFRSAIYGFSEKIESLPWDENFQYDCLKLYSSEVAPKVNEINELASETSTLKNFGGKVLADGEMRKSLGFVGAGLATTITTGMNISTALGMLESMIGLGAKIGLSAAGVAAFLKTTDLLNQAHKEAKKNKTDLANNVMYYYYLAKKKIH